VCPLKRLAPKTRSSRAIRIQQGGLDQKTLSGSKSYEERFKSENVDLILWLLISLE
jgi:hypothetical protein